MKTIFKGKNSSIWLNLDISMSKTGDIGLYEYARSRKGLDQTLSTSQTFGGVCSYKNLSIPSFIDSDRHYFYCSYCFNKF